jgi:membrane protein
VAERLAQLYGRARAFVREELWDEPPEPRNAAGRARLLLQFAAMVGEGFVRDRLLLRASALSYFTVLSLIPLLAVAVSIVGAIGGSGDFAELVVDRLAAVLTPEQRELILERVRGANFAGLGGLGAAGLFVTSVLAIGNVERALNQIWGVYQERPFVRRFPDYLAVLVVAPLLLGTALSLATTLQSQWLVQRLLALPGFALAYEIGLRQLPTLVLALGFAFLNWFLPNTQVRFGSALIGGAVSALLVTALQGLYIGLNVGVARANALFGSFAFLPLLMAWIYVFWAVVLFGAELAFAHQNLALYRREVRGRSPGPAAREAIGLRIALEIARAFRAGEGALRDEALADALRVPVRTVRDVLAHLERASLVAACAGVDREGSFQLARPAEQIQVSDVLAALRGPREAQAGDPGLGRAVEAVLNELEDGLVKGAAGRSLAELLGALPA